MLDAINDFVANGMDYVLSWILYLPRDVQLFLVAILTSSLMTVVRLWTTDQEWLGRAHADVKRLGELIKQAKRDGDKEAKKRYKSTVTLIKLKGLRFEGKPLLWAIIPVALLATWCFMRLSFEPPKTGKEIEVRLFTPKGDIGSTPHLLLPEGSGLEVDSAAQTVVPDEPMKYEGFWDRGVNEWVGQRMRWLPWYGQPALGGVAKWKVTPTTEGDQTHVLTFVHGGKTYEKELRTGGRFYPTSFQLYDDKVQGVEIVMKPTKLFGIIGGIDWLVIPGWLLAYLLIVIPFVSIIKRVFRIY